MKVTMICLGGLSTKIMASKIKTAAEAAGDKIDIITTGLTSSFVGVKDCDIAIMAPQIRYAEEDIRKEFAPIPVLLISSIEYGMQDGAGLYAKMKEMLGKGNQE